MTRLKLILDKQKEARQSKFNHPGYHDENSRLTAKKGRIENETTYHNFLSVLCQSKNHSGIYTGLFKVAT